MKYNPSLKRLLDLVLTAIALLILSPIFYFIIIFIRLDSTGPAFFKQKRIGQHFRPFHLIKFRSMAVHGSLMQHEFDPGYIGRVTRIGAFLRKTKLDELPELFNVLTGDMSIVGPRPEVEKYVNFYSEDFKEILKVRPGLSDYASIKYRDEEKILADRAHPEKFYEEEILPDKLHLAKEYIESISFKTDIHIIVETLKSIL